MKKSQIARIVAFDSLVRKKLYPNSINFSVDYEVSTRTIMRDVDYLRNQLEAPLEYDREKRGFYYAKDWNLPLVIRISAEKEDRAQRIIMQINELSSMELDLVVKALGKHMAGSLCESAGTPPSLVA